MQYSTSSENYSTSMRGDSPSRWGGKNDKGYAYKKSTYQYSTGGNNNISTSHGKPVDTNIDQLDALLEDLKNERQFTREKDMLSTSSNNYRTIERERVEPGSMITKTTQVVKTSKQSVPHAVRDDVETFSTSDYSTLKSNGYPGISDYHNKEKIYGSSNLYESKRQVYGSNRVLENTEIIPTVTTHTTTSSNLEKDLQNIPLTEDILPIPGTKVTTTVRTYTYEVPANGTLVRGTPLNSSYNTINRTEHSSSLHSSPHSPPSVPPTVVYNTESYSTINRNSERPVVSNQTYEVREHRETNTLQNSLQPQPQSPPIGGTNKTIVYKVNTTENIHTVPEFDTYPTRAPPPTTGPPYGSPPGNHPPGPTTSKYFYKESSNVVNTIHRPGGPTTEPYPPYGGPPQQPQNLSLQPGYPPNGPDYPHPRSPNTNTVTYKYSSSSATNTRRGPDGPYGGHPHSQPISQPAPFPVDGVEYPANGGPPQRVDDLMQSLGNIDSVDRSDTIHRKREVETSVASPNQQQIPSVNKAGKEIYYPPGHEMMLTKREEMAAGSAAGGRWAKGSGMYEYESGYKSKSKTKSGGAMVPVCLPLCCAMPCSIM